MTSKPAKKRKISTVFDAVAGRVSSEGFLSNPQPSKYRDTTSNSTTAIPPDEVLFRQKNAPSRYEEDDIYFADRHLESDQRLPDSDLLKAIHAYASDFYATSTDDRGVLDFRSLDETALIAMAILLEEAAAMAVDGTGYEGLVRGAEDRDAG